MSGWRETTLGELITVKHGYAFKGRHFAASGDEIVLTPGNFALGGGLQFRDGKQRYYTGPYPKEFKLSHGELLVVMTDLKQEAPILGSPAFVPTEPTVLHNQRLGLVKMKPHAELDGRFLYYALLSDQTRSQLRATATGSTVRHTAPDRIYRVKISVPALGVQRTIGSILGTLDDLIDNNTQRIGLLEQMAQAIYREWFVNFRYPGHGDSSFVDSAIGPIPRGWELMPFQDVASFVNGFPFKPSHWGSVGRPIIKIKELKQGITSDTPRCDESEIDGKYLVEPGDLLFSWSADLGVYRWSGEPGLLNQHLFLVRPRGSLSSTFLLHSLGAAMPEFRDRAQGTTMRHIKRSALSEVKSTVPSGPLVERFTQAAEPMSQQVLEVQRSNRALIALRELLLPKLVTGKIDVSHLDLDALVEAAISG